MRRFFFFQAEDGIRDLVRSRGLGDVYKRQLELISKRKLELLAGKPSTLILETAAARLGLPPAPVSYTHLTLPTSDLV